MTFKVDSYRKPFQNCFKTYKYCDNTRKYCNCRWQHFSSIGSILMSITTILASLEQVNTLIDHWPYVILQKLKKCPIWKLKGLFTFRALYLWYIIPPFGNCKLVVTNQSYLHHTIRKISLLKLHEVIISYSLFSKTSTPILMKLCM